MGLRIHLCWACAICQRGQAHYLYIRGTNGPFPRKPLSDKSKWAVLFSLLRETGMKDRQSLCLLWLILVAESKDKQVASLLLLW